MSGQLLTIRLVECGCFGHQDRHHMAVSLPAAISVRYQAISLNSCTSGVRSVCRLPLRSETRRPVSTRFLAAQQTGVFVAGHLLSIKFRLLGHF